MGPVELRAYPPCYWQRGEGASVPWKPLPPSGAPLRSNACAISLMPPPVLLSHSGRRSRHYYVSDPACCPKTAAGKFFEKAAFPGPPTGQLGHRVGKLFLVEGNYF